MRMKKIWMFLFLLGTLVFPTQKAIPAELNSISALPLFISDTYEEDDVLISFNRAYSKTDNYGSKYFIELNLKVLTENKIIKPSRYIYGIYVLDNFGNDLNVTGMAPRYYECLRPGDEKLFIITFSIKPLDNTKYLMLKIPKGIFGNVNPFELKIFNTGFKGPMTKEEHDQLESKVGLEQWQKENARIDFIPDDIEKKKHDKILYTAVSVGSSALCSLGLMLFMCIKTAKETVLRNNESFLTCFAHWINQNRLHLSILYIISVLISLCWLIFGIIILIVSGIGIAEDIFGIVVFLAAWALLSLVSLWMICEMLNECRTLDN